jgi:hypothetical protein
MGASRIFDAYPNRPLGARGSTGATSDAAMSLWFHQRRSVSKPHAKPAFDGIGRQHYIRTISITIRALRRSVKLVGRSGTPPDNQTAHVQTRLDVVSGLASAGRSAHGDGAARE